MLPFVVLAQIEAEKTIAQKGILDLMWESDPIVKFTLLTLLFFSVLSWAIILYKLKQIKQAQKDSISFWGTFSQSKSIEEAIDRKETRSGPLYEIFNAAIELLPRIKKNNKPNRFNREAITIKLTQTKEEEIYKLEQYTPFLATTASTAPFIGLFGTVWGILTAFWAIGKAGSSSLATVGPYISEALVATAIGLAAAIPAVVAYNFFIHRIKVIVKMMDLFLDDLVLKIEEEIVS